MSRTGGCGSVDALAGLWQLAGGDPAMLAQVQLSGAEPILPCSFRVGTAAQASIAASGLAAAQLHEARSRLRQRVSVDMRHAATEFRSESHLRIDGESPKLWDDLAGTYRCGDGRWVRIHTNFAHHRQRVVELLGCEGRRDALIGAFASWSAESFESRLTESGGIAAMMRSQDEWDAHPQGRAVGRIPALSVERLGDAPVEGPVQGDRPLAGVRVLDLTRIIAGPVAGRTLAAHGADVLLVTSSHLPSVLPLVADTGRGKLSCELDLREPAARDTLEELAGECDVFIQGYRPGAIAALGFSPQRLAKLKPGVIYVSLSAYGHVGPWCDRRGFDSIVQTASGFNAEEAHAAGVDTPRALPCQALDHASGYLMAFGVMMALHRRMTVGGSWHVRVALASTGAWIRSLGRLEGALELALPDHQAVADLVETSQTGFGRLTGVRHAALLSETPAFWSRPSVHLGTHPPVWPRR